MGAVVSCIRRPGATSPAAGDGRPEARSRPPRARSGTLGDADGGAASTTAPVHAAVPRSASDGPSPVGGAAAAVDGVGNADEGSTGPSTRHGDHHPVVPPPPAVVRTGSSASAAGEAAGLANGAAAGGEEGIPLPAEGGPATDAAEPPASGGDGAPVAAATAADGTATVAASASDVTAASVGSGGDGSSPATSPAKDPHTGEGAGVAGPDGGLGVSAATASTAVAAGTGGVDAAASDGAEAGMARKLSLLSEPHGGGGGASPPTPPGVAVAGTAAAGGAPGGVADDGVDESLLRALSSGGVLSAAAAWDTPAALAAADAAGAPAPTVSRQGSVPKYEVAVPGLKLAHAIPTEAETSDGGDGPGGPSTPVSPRYVERRPSMPPLIALGGGRRNSSAPTDRGAEAGAGGGGDLDGEPDEDLSRLHHTPSMVKRLAGEYEQRDQFAAEEREYIEATWRSLKEGPRTEAAEAVAADIAAAVAAANGEEDGAGGGGAAGGDPAMEKEPSFAIKAAIVAVASGAKLSPT